MERVYILDGKEFENAKETHMVLKKALQFPEYYGCNLDALYDCLTEMNAEIKIINFDFMKVYLDKDFEKFWNIFDYAQKENPLLHVSVLS